MVPEHLVPSSGASALSCLTAIYCSSASVAASSAVAGLHSVLGYFTGYGFYCKFGLMLEVLNTSSERTVFLRKLFGYKYNLSNMIGSGLAWFLLRDGLHCIKLCCKSC